MFSFKVLKLFSGTIHIWCASACLCEKVNLLFDSFVWLSRCTTCVHHPLFNYIRRQNERRSLPWNSWICQEKQLEREIDAPEHSSSQQLTWVIINISTNTPFKSPPIDIFDIAPGIVHLLFPTSVMEQLAPHHPNPHAPTPKNTHTNTEAHTLLILRCLWLKWLLTFGFGFEMCWNRERCWRVVVRRGISLDIKQLYPRRAVRGPFHRE